MHVGQPFNFILRCLAGPVTASDPGELTDKHLMTKNNWDMLGLGRIVSWNASTDTLSNMCM